MTPKGLALPHEYNNLTRTALKNKPMAILSNYLYTESLNEKQLTQMYSLIMSMKNLVGRGRFRLLMTFWSSRMMACVVGTLVTL